MNDAEKIAEDLLKIKAVSLSPQKPFTWASGLHTPIYCDNRMIMSFPEVRDEVEGLFAKKIGEIYPEVEVIAGTATAGIPHAAFIAERLHLPMIYIRSKPKDHGQGNQIEGQLLPGQKIVIIEDLISTGGSVLQAAAAAQKAGAEVLGVLAIFTYELAQSVKNFTEKGMPLYALTDYSTLIEVAAQTGYIEKNQLAMLKDWKTDPAAWSKAHAQEADK